MMFNSALLFVSGWNISANIFKPFVKSLAVEEKVFLGFMTPPLLEIGENGYDVAGSLLLKEVAKLKKIARNVYLVGWSMGGQVILSMANQLDVAGVVFLNSAAIFSRDQRSKRLFATQCATDFERAVGYFHKLMGKLSIEDSIVLKQNFINNKESALGYLKELHLRDLTDSCKALNIPVQIIHTVGDKIISVNEAEYLHNSIKESSLTILPLDSHFPFFDNRDKILDLLRNFMQV